MEIYDRLYIKNSDTASLSRRNRKHIIENLSILTFASFLHRGAN